MLDLDWIGAMRRVVAAHEELFAAAPTIASRSRYEGIGAGGDHTLVIDRQCEDAVFAELERFAAEGASFTAISEERGEVGFGDPGPPWRVVVDPIDGSLNTKRMLPSHSLSVAIASGPSMADVELGYIYDFGAGEEFHARRGAGSWLNGELNGEPIAVSAPVDGEPLEIVGIESAEPHLLWPMLEQLGTSVHRIRVVGSLALTAAYVGAGRFDAIATTHPCRSVDIAATQLIVTEAGGLVQLGREPLDQAGLGLDARYQMLAAATDAALATVRAAQDVVLLSSRPRL